MSRRKAPSLESLVNQCCEDYYLKLNQGLEASDNDDNHFSYEKFRDYIQSSHCQENLKFLIEIYHYEKIWNGIFKRQSSILKCKDEAAQQLQTQLQQQRKHSVATIFTSASSRRRHPSIIELPEPGDSGHREDSPDSQQQRMDSIHSLDNNDISNLVNDLTLPHVVTSLDDLDASSFVDLDGGPRSYPPHGQEYDESPSPVSQNPLHLTETNNTNNTSNTSNTNNNPPSEQLTLAHTQTRSSQLTNPNWDSLFKPGYQCDDDTHACLCNVPSHEHNLIELPEQTEPKRANSTEEYEYNESVKQMEVREQLKEELGEKFEMIMTFYVLNNSPYEINLPSDVYRDLVQEYRNTAILYHSPLTLLPAKNAVLQLLRENIYYKFLSEQEKLISKEDSERMIKDARPVSRVPLSNNSSYRSTRSYEPKYIPVRIPEHSESTTSGDDNLTRDVKNLHIETPMTTVTPTSTSTPTVGISSSTNTSNSGPISTFSSFFKNHLKTPATTPSVASMNSTDSTTTTSSPSTNGIQRMHTFAGNTREMSPKVAGPRTMELNHSSSIGDLRSVGKEKDGHEHGWSKLLRFKKKKNT